MCYFERQGKNKKYLANKKNGGNPPPLLDPDFMYVKYRCGNCMECRKEKANNWRMRLMEDIKENRNGRFVTLTFSNEAIAELRASPRTKDWPGLEGLEGYELDNEIATRAVRLFLENCRKETGKYPRHWLVTELGHNGTENVHLHGIIWTNDPTIINRKWRYGM